MLVAILVALWVLAPGLILIGVVLVCEWLVERRDPLERAWRQRARVPAREQLGVLSGGRRRQRHHGRRVA